MTGYRKRIITLPPGCGQAEICLDLIRETPLSIRIQGEPYTVVMRTPGDELAHVSGFCLTEGIADSPEDFAALGYCDEAVNVVTATLKPGRLDRIPDILNRRGFISQTSCGICGKELIDDLRKMTAPVPECEKVNADIATHCLNTLSDYQTRRYCSHTAVIFTAGGTMLSVGEDVGRHNALDKSIGKLFMEGTLDKGALLVLSSRVSYELVQKAARAKLPVIFSVSGPTSLAVELADSLDMAIVCQSKNKDLLVFCGGHRLEYTQKNCESDRREHK